VGQDIERATELFRGLYVSGDISNDSKDTLLAVNGAALEVGRGLGDESSSRELLLATVLVDDSTSIATRINEIRVGHTLMYEALADEASSADVQVMTRALNRGVMFPFCSLANATPLTVTNFSGNSLVPETPLYLQSVLTLGTVLMKSREVQERGAEVRTFTLIITDGADNQSRSITADHVRALVADMLEFHTNHIVAGMGIGETPGIDYRQIFRSMGITRIYTAGTTADELRTEFRKVASDLKLAASSEAAFRQLASGSPPDCD
jgi:hypothetical protein